MDYLKYVMIVGLASLSVAAVCCASLWLMAPLILARARRNGGEPMDDFLPETPHREEAGGVTFNFTPEQGPALAGLLQNEGPEDIAIVLSHLPAEAGRAFFSALNAETRAKVLLSLATPRNVDMDLIRGMKAELENRLYGVVGSPAEAASFIAALPYKERKAILEKIVTADPDRGAELRAFFIFDEDLRAMPETDFKALAAAVTPQTMGGFLPALPEKLRIKIKDQYPGKLGLALEKAAPKGEQGPKEKEAALARFMELAEKLAAKGIIARPKPGAKTAGASAARNIWGIKCL
ncbi:MAG: hypothetical protein COX65_04890 [Elusimicrobia bacterium CG_4_10_14_0_2_um_filter_56_8]|nr:MAG: hypothetical protein AUJ51_06470 [Elusimicrobia bacterium CG1_02_56_21]PJA14974.1 MAG: hypothetical protein COX65_04890 [Elusimicrobia bacterium CG_4_10_14_0_2_um_filter_56_8]